MSIDEFVKLLLVGTGETLIMTVVSSLISFVLGLPVGLLLVISNSEGIKPMKKTNMVVGFITNMIRSVPFLILLLALDPLTRFIVGTSIGTKAMIVPLVFAATPYIARLVESSLLEVEDGVIEAAKSMGASTMQIVTKVLVPEALPSLITGAAIAVTTILGYSAMAGIIGGGGLGDIAMRYGYYRKGNPEILVATVLVLIIIVQIFQETGIRLNRHQDKRNN
ncbi:MAG TPA: ABC transporter permease [Candidatus Merdenecus merdavium]|nr:ABC transporter permease [Candidatus Merdenecus merdavium]